MSEFENAYLAIAHSYSIYARAIDEKRFDLLESVFHPDAALEYVVGPHTFHCTGLQAPESFGRFLAKCWWTNHLIAAPAVERSGARFHATARVQATHLQRRLDGTLSRWLVRGSYHDTFERHGEAWLITHRFCCTPDEEGGFLDVGVESFDGVAWTTVDKLTAVI